MAIAFRSVGARLKADVSIAGGSLSVQLPTGHASGDLLLMFVLTDANSSSTDPAGWDRTFYITVGGATASPYNPAPRLKVYARIDNGSLGSTVPLTFNTSGWPTGNPYVLAFTAAYSGCDPSGPIEYWAWRTTTDTTAAQAHPAVTTAATGDWLLTFRAVSSDSPAATFTNSVGTDVERVDDSDGFNELAVALYDANAALAAGAQTVRTTTASRAATYGSLLASFALKPASTATATYATPGVAQVTATAPSPTVQSQNGGWDLCDPGGLPAYQFSIDWDGQPGGTGEDVTGDIISDIPITYGRDQERQLKPAAVGSSSFTLNNVSRAYSPENTDSPLYGDLDPARAMTGQVTFEGQTYPLFRGRIDDFNIKADFNDRTVDFTFLDGLNDLAGVKLSTGVYAAMRTGDLINVVLDEAGWTGGRDIDPGATLVKYWWLSDTDALSAINDLVKSEGPPAIAYCAPDGTLVFRDRHHRLLRQASRTVQATFHADALGDCTANGVPQGALSLAKPFSYAHGWRDIVNSVAFDVTDREPSYVVQQVWQDTSTYVLSIGQSIDLTVSGSDPFINAVTPVPGTDIVYTGAGVLNVLLDRTSGATAKLTIQAVGAGVTITSVQVRAQSLVAQPSVRVSQSDAVSIEQHGERAYPDGAPWAGVEDAQAIASMILLHYAERRPTVQIRIVSSDPAHYVQVLQRTISDRIHITNDEMRLDADFFVERVTHTIQRTGVTGRPPVHAVVLACEKDQDTAANPFTFDKRGAGFDMGVFDPLRADDEDQVFVFDDPVQGAFNFGEFGT
jgi:hypothetical protein